MREKESGDKSPHSKMLPDVTPGLMMEPNGCYRFRWVVPPEGEPIEAGEVRLGDGVVTDVGKQLGERVRDVGNAALIAGLVNAHTHLEFSGLPAPLGPADPFPQWIRAVVAHRRTRTTDSLGSVAAGLDESRRCGVTAIGEISTSDEYADAYRASPCRSVVFRELLGLGPENVAAQVEIAAAHLDAEPGAPHVRHGLSPHAPYSVHPDLFARAVDMARARRAPLAMHLAETSAELELLASGRGELAEMLRAFGVWRPELFAEPRRPLDYLAAMTELPSGLVIHGNYLNDEETRLLAECTGLTLVVCPRTHRYFGHPPHPWPEVIRRGGRVAIGTDSRASNPDLDLWREAVTLAVMLGGSEPSVHAADVLRMATTAGEAALFGPEAARPTLIGRSLGELTVIALPARSSSNLYDLLFDPTSHPTGLTDPRRLRAGRAR